MDGTGAAGRPLSREPPPAMADTPAKPAPTPESLLDDFNAADRVLVWMNRLRWPAAALPLLVAAGFQAYCRWGLQVPVAVADWPWALGGGLAASLICWAGMTWMARHFRRAIAKARENLYAKVPRLRPPA